MWDLEHPSKALHEASSPSSRNPATEVKELDRKDKVSHVVEASQSSEIITDRRFPISHLDLFFSISKTCILSRMFVFDVSTVSERTSISDSSTTSFPSMFEMQSRVLNNSFPSSVWIGGLTLFICGCCIGDELRWFYFYLRGLLRSFVQNSIMAEVI